MTPEVDEKSWRAAYALVLGALVAEVMLLAWLSWSFQ